MPESSARLYPLNEIVQEFKEAWREGGYARLEVTMVLFALLGLIGAIVDVVL